MYFHAFMIRSQLDSSELLNGLNNLAILRWMEVNGYEQHHIYPEPAGPSCILGAVRFEQEVVHTVAHGNNGMPLYLCS